MKNQISLKIIPGSEGAELELALAQGKVRYCIACGKLFSREHGSRLKRCPECQKAHKDQLNRNRVNRCRAAKRTAEAEKTASNEA